MCKVEAKRRLTKTELEAMREEEAIKQDAIQTKLDNYELWCRESSS